MIDTYTVIIWSKANDDSLEEQKKQMFDILSILSNIEYFKPRYLTSYRKKDVKEFELSVENVENLIIDNKDKQFCGLGSRISFFTSFDETESVGISMSIGVSIPQFLNTLVIDLNLDIKKQNVVCYDEVANLFKELVIAFNSFYGCITCKSNRKMFDGYYNDEKNVPFSIFDLNYWGKDVLKNLRVNDMVLAEVYDYEKINDGYYIRLQKEPIDISNIEHLKLQKKINDMLEI